MQSKGDVMNEISIQSPDGTKVKTLSPSYSITTLLFSFFVPLFRKDWKYFGIILGSFCALLVIAVLFIPEDLLKPTGTAFNFFWTFFYNRFWIKDRVFNDGCLPMKKAEIYLKRLFLICHKTTGINFFYDKQSYILKRRNAI